MMMNGELRGYCRKWSWPTLWDFPSHFPTGAEKNHECLSQESQTASRDSN